MQGSKDLINGQKKEYDFIILGAGCAGLSLLMRMIRSGNFAAKKILLIDRSRDIRPGRTWCFWETGPGFFEEIVYRQWHQLDFLSDSYTSTLDISPYRYKMIRGIDFFGYCFNEITKHQNIEVRYGNVKRAFDDKNGISIEVDGEKLDCADAVIFNSVYVPDQEEKKEIRLLQHFKGWVLETKDLCFNPERATLMDFRIHQDHGNAFMYVLPFSGSKALVEYTLFTKKLLEKEQYVAELRSYIKDRLKIMEYNVLEEETGVIPMTSRKFPFYDKGVYHIGTAGGQTKASTGYTFQFIQKQTRDILDCLVSGKPLHTIPATPARFRFYDNTLLDILYQEKIPGETIFSELFKKNKAPAVLKFLDNETSVKEELKIIATLPTGPFLKAGLRQIKVT